MSRLVHNNSGQKLCWYCDHFFYDAGSPELSEYTPAEGTSLLCKKGHFTDYYGFSGETHDITQVTKAGTCSDFRWSKAIQEHLGAAKRSTNRSTSSA